jgi:hypothetical protein
MEVPLRGVLLFTAAACLLGAAACGSTGFTPRLGTETSHDGLVKVENARVSAAWLRPDFDLAGYRRVKLEGAGIAYRPLRGMGGSGAAFPVSESAQQRLLEILEEEFRSELGKSTRFELTEEIGPDVLLVWGGLLDVISHAPPASAGRETVYLRSLGEATLVVELRDSQSNATLARILDRREVGDRSSASIRYMPGSGGAEFRRMAGGWARRLRQRLDDAPTLSGGAEVAE